MGVTSVPMTYLCRIARTDTKVPAVRLTLDPCTAGGGIWKEDGDALFGCWTEETTFLRATCGLIECERTWRNIQSLRIILRAG